MSTKMTALEWAQKADWEGGVMEAFEYGLRATDLAADADPNFVLVVKLAEDAYIETYGVFEDLQIAIRDTIDDADDE